jgi:hypothetical protein
MKDSIAFENYPLSTLSLQKSEGSRAKASKGVAVVGYCKPLATRDLESSGFPPNLIIWGEKR